MNKPRLYVKSGCPWCNKAEDYLKRQGIEYERIDVLKDSVFMQEMVRISGQRKAPTLDLDGEVLADFGVEELDDFLRRRDLM